MDRNSFHKRKMLNQYNRQLMTARRIERYQDALALVGEGITAIPAEVRRKALVERVAREIFEHLLFTGNNTAMVKEVQKALAIEFGKELFFKYPPGSMELVLFKRTPEGIVEVSQKLRADILERAWAITLKKVDETMA